MACGVRPSKPEPEFRAVALSRLNRMVWNTIRGELVPTVLGVCTRGDSGCYDRRIFTLATLTPFFGMLGTDNEILLFIWI